LIGRRLVNAVVIGQNMRTLGRFAILSLCCVGCDGTAQQQKPASRQTPAATSTSVDEYIANFGDMGMWLPDAKQVGVFRDNFDTARSSLRDALSHSSSSVRMRSAYVIGEIGTTARPAGQELLDRFKNEPDVLVRIYIVDALNAIGYDDHAAVAVLIERYKALNGTNVPPNGDSSYADVDEKIKIASAVYSLTSDEVVSEYYDFVTKWLDPPDGGLSSELLEGYWERRWIAVNSLERMPAAKLESLQAERNAKPWVNTHVPRVLAVLRKNAR
jgi:hypothetical protein